MIDCKLNINQNDVSKNYTQLATHININLLKLYRLQQQYKQLQTEIDAFLEQYYAAITPHLMPYFSSQNHINNNLIRDEVVEYCHNFEMLLKQLYRRLAKYFHPDSGNQTEHSVMARLNAAYQNKELGSLLTFDLPNNMSDNLLTLTENDLLHYHQLIKGTVAELQEKLDSLNNCEANILRQTSLRARLEGRNITNEVIEKLKAKYQYVA
jgi:hypothetical protein